MMHVQELKRLGADIEVEGNTAIVTRRARAHRGARHGDRSARLGVPGHRRTDRRRRDSDRSHLPSRSRLRAHRGASSRRSARASGASASDPAVPCARLGALGRLSGRARCCLECDRISLACVESTFGRIMSTAHHRAVRRGASSTRLLPLLAAAGIAPLERSGDLAQADPGEQSAPTCVSSSCARPTCRPTFSTAPPIWASPARTCCSSTAAKACTSRSISAIGRCRMVVAAERGLRLRERRAARRAAQGRDQVRRTAREHFAAKGMHVDLIKLYGSMELAPLVGLADAIVDLVSTGNTLKANDLVAVEDIRPISARLIVNPGVAEAQARQRAAGARRDRGGCARPA